MKHIAAAAIAALLVGAQDESPCSKEKTGVSWVHPFGKALERAGAKSRLLMIKPISFGTSPDGGW